MRYLCHVGAALAAACLLCAYWLPGAWRLPLAAVLLAMGLACLLLRRRGRMVLRLALWLLSAAVGLGGYSLHWALRVAPARALDGQTVTAAAELRMAPAETAYGAAVPVWLELDGRRLSMQLYLDECGGLLPGDRLSGTFRLRLPRDERETDGEPGYLRASGIYLAAVPEGTLDCTRPERVPLRYWPAVVRLRVGQVCGRLFSAETAPWFTALLTNQNRLTYADRNSLKLAGLYHCICTSGMHIHVLMALISLLCLRRRRLAAALGLPVCAFFWAVAGGTPSVSRAVVMQAILLLAPLLHREHDTPTALAAALIVLLLRQPDSIAHLGLQLSFLSVLGIELVSGRLYRALLRRSGDSRLLRWAASAVCTSLGALLLTTPLLAWRYGMVPLLAPLTGLLCLDAVMLCFAAGLPAALLGLWIPAAGRVLALPLEWLMRYVIAAVRLAARLPVLYLSDPVWIVWLAVAYGLALLMLLPGSGKRVPLACLAASFAAAVLLHTVQVRRPVDGFRLTVLDVGQGQCLVLRSGEQTCVIDCGGSWPEDAGEQCARYLLGQGVRRIDLLVLTHYHADHAGGVAQLLSRVEAGQVLLPDVPDDTGNRAVIERAAAGRIEWVTDDRALPLGEGTLRLFAPRSDAGDNEACVSLLASFGQDDVLVTGDMDSDTEFLLCKTAELPDVEVYVVAHHGSRYASGAYFLSRILPELAVISVGRDNGYGHPASETLERLAAIGSQVLRTDELGTIVIER